jgi:hypothetical protein
MKKVALIVSAVLLAGSMAMAASGGGVVLSRVGVGLGLDTVDVRAELGSRDAVGVAFGLTSFSGDLEGSRFGFGINYLHRLSDPKPVAAHFIGGFMVNSYDKYPMTLEGYTFPAGAKLSKITLFAGLGAEYFLPGTTQISIEANTGFEIVNVSGDGEGSLFGIAPVPTGGLMIRYYFE